MVDEELALNNANALEKKIVGQGLVSRRDIDGKAVVICMLRIRDMHNLVARDMPACADVGTPSTTTWSPSLMREAK